MTTRRKNWNGMNWIRQEKRLAIYIRDDFSCIYCGSTVEDGVILSLDHIKPDCKKGSNSERNLITCCKRCNSSRGSRKIGDFVRAVSQYIDHGISAEDILAKIRSNTRKSLKSYLIEAKNMISRRGSVSKIISEKNQNNQK
jgi:5-methylcytosine-specific restriction endonuclease McrA